MKTTFDILYTFFSAFNLLVAGFCLGRFFAGRGRKSENGEAPATRSTVIIVDVGGSSRSRPGKTPPTPSGNLPGELDEQVADADDEVLEHKQR